MNQTGSPTWQTAPPLPELQLNQAYVFCMPLIVDADREQQLSEHLTQEEQARAARFATRLLQTKFIAARGQLREILAAYLGMAPGMLRFTYSAYGKPALDFSVQAANRLPGPLCFNLAHSGDLALLAVTFGQEVGIDLEDMRRPVDYASIARHYFSPREVAELLSLPADQQRQGFFNGWTRKEAYIKARGMGLSIPLDSFAVSLSPTLPARFVEVAAEEDAEEGWQLYEIRLISGYMAAMVVKGNITNIKYRSWINS